MAPPPPASRPPEDLGDRDSVAPAEEKGESRIINAKPNKSFLYMEGTGEFVAPFPLTNLLFTADHGLRNFKIQPVHLSKSHCVPFN